MWLTKDKKAKGHLFLADVIGVLHGSLYRLLEDKVGVDSHVFGFVSDILDH